MGEAAAVDTRAVVPVRAPLIAGHTPRAIVPSDIDQVWRIATMVAKANLAPRELDSEEKITIAILHGLEIGLPPMMALQRITVINGRPAVWGDAVPGIALGTGQLEDWKEEFVGEGDQMVAICTVKRKGIRTPKEATFSVADAKRADLWDDRPRIRKRNRKTNEWYEADNDSPWYRYWKRMLQMRARVAFRDLFADAFSGLYIAEELISRQTEDEAAAGAKDVTPRQSAKRTAPPAIEAPKEQPMQPVDAGEVVEAEVVETKPAERKPLPPLAKGASQPQTNGDDGLDIPPALRRNADNKTDGQHWLSELRRSLEGCATLEDLTEIQNTVQKPMQGKVSKAEYAEGQTLVMEAFHRISNDGEVEEGEE